MHLIENDPRPFRRLSKNILPINYELKIIPNFDNFTFSGSVKIEIDIIEEADVIELHSLELNLNEITFNYGNNVINYSKLKVIKSCESVEISFPQKLPTGRNYLKIDFDGVLNDNLDGFYKTKCLNRNGESCIAAVTQFEAPYARKSFPCFDEPSFKASFDICIIADPEKTVLSNTPLKSIEPYEKDSKLCKFQFEKSVVMSTYLVAYVIGYYDYVEAVDELGTKIRVYTPIGKSEMGRFSLDIAVKAIPFFTKFFGIKYPLAKLDLIGLNDVEIEAMENFGLLTFKESLLLIDQSNFSIQTRAEVALVVAHEIAHQWFGNIVTMEWWTDLWLNEGFATWIEYLCIDYCFPEWNIWNLYATDHLYRAFNLDGLKSSHPIEVNVGPPSEINQIFDSISYCKGSAVLRMLNDYVGKDAFVKGLQNYLQKYKFKNATSDNLWNEIDNASNKPVKKMMQAWTKKQGYPVVYVSKKNGPTGNTILILNQIKFYNNPLEKDELEEKLWNIPITISTKSSFPNVFKNFFMDSKSVEFDLGVLSNDEWIKLNSNNIGFYKVCYSNELFDRFFKNLEDISKLGSPLDRYGLVNDAFSFIFSADIAASELLRLLEHFKKEKDVYVWITIFKNLHFLSKCLLDKPYFEKFKQFLSELFADIRNEIGFEIRPNEGDSQKLLRENVMYFLAKIDDIELKKFALNAYLDRKNTRINADLQKAIYTSVLRNGNIAIVDEFIGLYQNSTTPEEKEKTAILLGEVCSSELIDKVLEFSISPIVTLEETVFIIVAMAKNSTNKISLHKAWNFVKNNWSLFIQRYADSVLLGRLLKPMIECFSTTEMLEEVEKFFEKNPTPQADQAVKQAIELIKSNIYFLTKQNGDLEKFFS